MADNRYGEPRGGDWRERERRYGDSSRSNRVPDGWGRPSSNRDDDDRGFFERAGEEIKSWFGSDDDDDRRGYGAYDRDRDYGRSASRSQGEQRGRVQSWSEGNRGSGTFGEDTWRGSSGGSDFSRNRGEWAEDRSGRGSYGRSASQGDYGSGRDDWERSRQRVGSTSPSTSSESYGYSDMSGTLGGFGNQTFGSSQDDHYRSWRDRQIESLDKDYQDYCREREQQFHSDFDTWRKARPAGQSQSGGGMSASGQASDSETLELGGSSTSSESSTGTSGERTTADATGSFIGGGGRDPSAATAGGGGDPDPVPASTGSSRSSRSRTS